MSALTAQQIADLRGDLGLTNNVQAVTLVGTPISGAFMLTHRGSTSASIAYNATAATVETALDGMPTIGSGNAQVAGAAGGPWTLTIAGDGIEMLTASNGTLAGATVEIENRLMLTDEDWQRLYDRAGSDESLTMVYAFRRLLARASKLSIYMTGQTDTQKTQIFQNLQALLAYWEKVAGVSKGTLRAGIIDLDIDRADPGDDTSLTDFEYWGAPHSS